MTKHRFTPGQLTLAALALAMGTAAGSALAANATATSTSTVVTPISITKGADLSFGSFASSAAGGTVTVTPGGTRSVSGGVTAAGGTASAARFDVSGSGSLTYSIVLGGDASLSDGSNSMAFTSISDLSASASTSGNVSSGTLSAGAQSIFVGGILTVGASQPAGTYTGSVTATVEYN
ncbi:DUF4402 domain-containing protein [Massilia sp. UMI-21]|nr:DUF4402 domain-containing protein [Massilia sp. UMI-21]